MKCVVAALLQDNRRLIAAVGAAECRMMISRAGTAHYKSRCAPGAAAELVRQRLESEQPHGVVAGIISHLSRDEKAAITHWAEAGIVRPCKAKVLLRLGHDLQSEPLQRDAGRAVEDDDAEDAAGSAGTV